MTLIEFLEAKEDLVFSGARGDDRIAEAETKLRLSFAEEYKEYLRKFGSASYDGHELTGINRSKRLNVVECTIAQRELNDVLSADMYVVEDVGIDGVIVLQRSDGGVYMLFSYDNEISKEADSLLEYLKKNE